MTDKTEDELRRKAKAARAAWWTIKEKAQLAGEKERLAAEDVLGLDALSQTAKDAERRLEEHATKGMPELIAGWKWDEWGRACCEFPNQTVCLTGGDVEFMDHNEDVVLTSPVAVVRAVLAAEGVGP